MTATAEQLFKRTAQLRAQDCWIKQGGRRCLDDDRFAEAPERNEEDPCFMVYSQGWTLPQLRRDQELQVEWNVSVRPARDQTIRSFTTEKKKAWDRLPQELDHIRVAIEESRRLLELNPNEDVPGAAYTEATWTRAVEFVTRNALWLWDRFGRVVDAPEILPGPKGSIDLDWDYPSYEILINIPSDSNAKAGFYGDDRGEIAIKGTFDPNAFNNGLLLWLARAK